MSRIAVLVGSPRKGGNTDLLARAFAEGAGLRHQVSMLSVAGLDIHPCRGCNACYASEGNRCIQQDGMDQVYAHRRALKEGRSRICPTCRDTLREFTLYRWDENAVRDVPKKENDHAMDDLRYFVTTALQPPDDSFYALSVER